MSCNLTDGGDCVQLCFENEYSNCTWDLFANSNVCDEECDNMIIVLDFK